MTSLKTTYKIDYGRPKTHHFSSVSKLKNKSVKFEAGQDTDRINKCLAKKYEKVPETINLYPFVKICSFEQIHSDEKTTYQKDFPDKNYTVSQRLIKEFEPSTDPCRFLYNPSKYPRLSSDVTQGNFSTKRIPKNRYPRIYSDVTLRKTPGIQVSNKMINISRHVFDRTKTSEISDALPGGKCTTFSTEYQDGIGTYTGIFHKKKPASRLKCPGKGIFTRRVAHEKNADSDLTCKGERLCKDTIA